MKNGSPRLGAENLKALHNAVQDTLETLTFAEALPVDAGTYPALRLPLYVTTVEVKKPYPGTICLMMNREMAIATVRSMLGCSDHVDEEWVRDGLSELVNTIGGRVLANLVDASSSFDLGIPQTEFVEKERTDRSGGLVRQAYAVNEGHFELVLDLKLAQAA